MDGRKGNEIKFKVDMGGAMSPPMKRNVARLYLTGLVLVTVALEERASWADAELEAERILDLAAGAAPRDHVVSTMRNGCPVLIWRDQQ